MSSTDTDTQRGVYVPPFDQRDRIPQEAIDDLVRQIAEKFHPERIILFGSYAYGSPRPDSDVDLLVVMDTPLSEIQQEVAIWQTIRKSFGLDLLVYKPNVLAERLELGDFFLREIMQRGRVVYEQSGH